MVKQIGDSDRRLKELETLYKISQILAEAPNQKQARIIGYKVKKSGINYKRYRRKKLKSKNYKSGIMRGPLTLSEDSYLKRNLL